MTTLAERYPDLLSEGASAERARLIAGLEQTLTLTPPPRLAAAMDRAIAARLAAVETGPGGLPVSRRGAAPPPVGEPRRPRAWPDDPRRRLWQGRVPSLMLALLALGGSITASRLLPQGPGAGKAPPPAVAPLLSTVLTDTSVWNVLSDEPASRVVLSTTHGVRVLDGHSGSVAYRVAGDAPLAVDSRTGHLFGLTRDDRIGEFDPATGRVLRTIPVTYAPGTPYGGGGLVALAFDRETGRLFMAREHIHQPANEFHYSDATAVTTIEWATGRAVRTLYLGRSPAALAVDERTHHVFLSTVHTVAMLDGRTGALLHTFRPSPSSQDAHLALVTPLSSRLGRVFVINDISGDDPTASHTTVSLLDTRTGRAVATLPGGLGRSGVAVDEARGRAYLADGDQVTVLDARTGQVLRRLNAGGAPSALAVDTRTGHLLVARTGPVDAGGIPQGRGRLSIINPEGGAVLTTYTTGYMPWDIVALPDAGRAFIINAGARRDGPAPLALPASVTMLILAR